MPETLKPEHTAVHNGILLFLKTPFVLPASSKPVDFDSIMGGNLLPEARQLLQLATVQRAKLLEVLSDQKLDVRNLIASVDAYLPSLWQLTASLQAAQESSIKLVKKLEFKWSSSLSKKPKDVYCGQVLLFETSFVLTIRALAHRDAAKIAMDNSETDYAAISRELRTGAGIFEFMGNDLLARFADDLSQPQTNKPLETNRLVMASLGGLFLADAQRVAIAKAVEQGSSPSIVAKLLIGCAEKYEFSTRCITQLSKQMFDLLVPGLLEELGAMPAILRGLAANCLAQMYWQKEEWSKALGFAHDATKRLGIISMGAGLQKSALQGALDEALKRNRVMEGEYLHLCNLVYFVKPAEQRDLQVPNGSFIIDPIPYELPLAQVVSFSSTVSEGYAAALKANVQTFWTALWAKPLEYPQSSEEALVHANKMSGARGELPSTFYSSDDRIAVPEMPKEAEIPTPAGMDPGVFASLPRDIQREIAAEHNRS